MVKISRNRATVLLVIVAAACLLVSGAAGAANLTFKAMDFDAQFLRSYGYTPVAVEFGFPVLSRFEGVLGIGSTRLEESATYPDSPEFNSSDVSEAMVYSFGLRYYLAPGNSYDPFLFGTIGLINAEGGQKRFIQPSGSVLELAPFDSNLQYQANMGLGARFRVTEDWSLVGEAGLKTITSKVSYDESNGSVRTVDERVSVLYSALGLRFDF